MLPLFEQFILEKLNTLNSIQPNKDTVKYVKNRVSDLLFSGKAGLYKGMKFADTAFRPDNDTEFPEYITLYTDGDIYSKYDINKNKPEDYTGIKLGASPADILDRPLDVSITMYDQKTNTVNGKQVYTVTYQVNVEPKGTIIK